MTAALVANARMYSVAPGARAAWHALFQCVSAISDLPLDIIDHAYPAPLHALWTRQDLGCAFICGWPYVRGVADLQPIAAPVMADPRAGHRPVYWTDLVVRTHDPAQSLEDLRGRRIAYTTSDSQSGFNALRHFLRGIPGPRPLFGAEIGPLITPRRTIEAVIAGDVDAGPVDSLAHALLQRHAPELATQVRVIAETVPTAAPLLVASRSLDAACAQRLRRAFLVLADNEMGRHLLEDLALERFADPLPHASYMELETAARAAEAAGISRLETVR